MSQLNSLPITPVSNVLIPPTALRTTSGSVTVDFLEPDAQTITLSGNVTLVPINYQHAGFAKTLAITGGASSYTVTLPAGWILLGGLTSPISVAAGKRAILSLAIFGVNDASSATTSAVWVSYSVES